MGIPAPAGERSVLVLQRGTLSIADLFGNEIHFSSRK